MKNSRQCQQQQHHQHRQQTVVFIVTTTTTRAATKANKLTTMLFTRTSLIIMPNAKNSKTKNNKKQQQYYYNHQKLKERCSLMNSLRLQAVEEVGDCALSQTPTQRAKAFDVKKILYKNIFLHIVFKSKICTQVAAATSKFRLQCSI